MTTFKIYYMGRYKKHFHNRDQAMNWIVQEVKSGGLNFDDFEILDGSDEL